MTSTSVEVSVIVPTFNRAGVLRTCLEALFVQSQPAASYETIVVMDGCTDGTKAMLEHLAAPCRLTVLWQPNSGAAAARNRGIQAATGEYCLFIDDDIVAGQELVSNHLEAQKQQHGIVGLGDLEMRLDPTAPGLARYLAAWLANARQELLLGLRAPSFTDCYSGNLSVPLAAMLEVGGFSEDIRRFDDIDLGFRLWRLGLPLRYLPQARGSEDFHKDFSAMCRDIEHAGADSVELYHRYPEVLPHLQLGHFWGAPLRVVLARRALLAMHLGWRSLAFASLFLSSRRLERRWFSFVYDYFYWRGVRASAGSAREWRRLTSPTPLAVTAGR